MSCDGGSHRDTCWEDNFTGSVLSWMCPPAGCPGRGRMHRWPCPAGIPGSNQLGLALEIECGALHCSVIDMQRDPQQLPRSILSLVVGCPLSTALQALFKPGPFLQHSRLLQKLGSRRCLQPSRLWLPEKALRSPMVSSSKRCCRLPAFSRSNSESQVFPVLSFRKLTAFSLFPQILSLLLGGWLTWYSG